MCACVWKALPQRLAVLWTMITIISTSTTAEKAVEITTLCRFMFMPNPNLSLSCFEVMALTFTKAFPSKHSSWFITWGNCEEAMAVKAVPVMLAVGVSGVLGNRRHCGKG